MYNKVRIFAFVNALGDVGTEWAVAAACCVNWGFPTIADTDITQILPTGICTYEHVVSPVSYDEICEIAGTAIELIVSALPAVVDAPDDLQSHIALGLGTDLGGYAIMIAKTNPKTNSVERGGTNGGHLGSFQLTDYLSHGRACALLNPYYTVLFANAIEDQCRIIGKIYQKHNYIDSSLNLDKLTGRELALEVAKGMIVLSKKIKFPTALKDTDVSKERIAVMVEQSENPQLGSKLKNMPVPMNVDKGDVRTFILPTLEAAYVGDLDAVPTA